MGWLDDAETELLADTGAARIEVSIIGGTLHFADGYKALITSRAAQHIGSLIHSAESKMLKAVRDEFRRGKRGFVDEP
jgi:hypothetical protein